MSFLEGFLISGVSFCCVYVCAASGGSSPNKKGKSGKKPRRRTGKKKGEEGEREEAGEETDEGDMEGEEVDYMSRSSSESEEEFQVVTLPPPHTHTHCVVEMFGVVVVVSVRKPWLYNFGLKGWVFR